MTDPQRPELAGLTEFLGAHPPFSSMAADTRAQIAAAAQERRFATDELVVDYATHTPDEVWLVRTGRIVLHSDAAPDAPEIDSIDAGGVFGYVPLLTDGEVAFAARAVKPSTVYRLPGALTRSLFRDPAGLKYLSTNWDSARPRTQQFSLRRAADLIPGEPVFVDPRTSVRDAVRHMADRRVSYALVRGHRELGIFTDRDLRTRVVAADIELDTPIRQVVSTPAKTAGADSTAAAVLTDMLEAGLRHMPVIDHRGAVLGVVEDRDLIASGAWRGFALRRSIALAADLAELRTAARGVSSLAVDVFRGGADAASTSAMLSVVIDAVVRRALELHLLASSGPAPEPFALMLLGSIARREAMPSSDVDSAMSWAVADDLEAGRLRRLAAEVHETLDACGLPADSNGALASTTRFSRSAGQWADAAAHWLDRPLADRGLIMLSLLLDARTVYGDSALNTAAPAFETIAVAHPEAMRLQMLDALSGKPRTRSMRDIRHIAARRGGTFDLKAHALAPIVNLARWAGVTAGVVLASTPARLAAGAQRGALNSTDAVRLTEVFDLVQRLRMAHQVDQLAAGRAPGDIIVLSELSPLSRSLLTDGVREVAAVQRRVRSGASAELGRAPTPANEERKP